MVAPAQSMLCHASDSVLLLIDIQARLTAATTEESRRLLLRNSAILLEAAMLLEIPVLVSEQYPKGLGRTEVSLAQKFPATIQGFEKTVFACSGADGFMDTVHNHKRRQVIIAGMETHVCVLQTALELKAGDFQVFVAEDATCSRKPQHSLNALQRLRDAGVIVANTESVVFEWLRDANHEHFKKISGLIR